MFENVNVGESPWNRDLIVLRHLVLLLDVWSCVRWGLGVGVVYSRLLLSGVYACDIS